MSRPLYVPESAAESLRNDIARCDGCSTASPEPDSDYCATCSDAFLSTCDESGCENKAPRGFYCESHRPCFCGSVACDNPKHNEAG